jgi:hypothetical protein
MSGFGSAMRKRFAKLREAGEDVRRIMADVNRDATVAAVAAATYSGRFILPSILKDVTPISLSSPKYSVSERSLRLRS